MRAREGVHVWIPLRMREAVGPSASEVRVVARARGEREAIPEDVAEKRLELPKQSPVRRQPGRRSGWPGSREPGGKTRHGRNGEDRSDSKHGSCFPRDGCAFLPAV